MGIITELSHTKKPRPHDVVQKETFIHFQGLEPHHGHGQIYYLVFSYINVPFIATPSYYVQELSA